MKTGLVVGKFYPPHAGHQFLIDSAKSGCDELTILIIGRDDELPRPEQREVWLRELYPNDVVAFVPDIYDDDNSRAWADFTIEILGEAPDVVFTSEEYGKTWAEELGCEHVLVDIERETIPISGTKVRNDPLASWQYLHPVVRAHYVKRVCVLGAESTGTTTLTKALAEKYETTWAPEFGRTYTYGKVLANEEGRTWQSQEFSFIAEQQNALEDQLARYANKIMFCDTDSFATAIWHERYMDSWSESVERLFRSRHYDLYVLTDVDIPFVQDGVRDGEHIRMRMHQRFIELLEKYDKSYVIASGPVATRCKEISIHCDALLKGEELPK